MTDQTEFITIFRSGDHSAEAEATEIRERLAQAGINAIVLGDDAPGVIEGTWEVRVAVSEQNRAEALLAALEQQQAEDQEEVSEEALSHELDFVNVFVSQDPDAEMEAVALQTALKANGIPAIVIGSAQFPSLPFEVRVPKSRLDDALALIADANQSGASVEGERA
jgi:hypothetical protein